ncbi:MAG: roadblock/LC7 domain-containing protein [Actinomycetota bacterium]|nr:roadblock/LC7 domain-containing protein [Actinomycetota bacterium]
MDANQALTELAELSSQIDRAAVLDAKGAVLAATGDGGEALAQSALELLAAAGGLHASTGRATRAEVEIAEGGLFVLVEGERTIVATTKPDPTSGLVVYDLRTCLAGITEPKPKRPRTKRKPKPNEEDGE